VTEAKTPARAPLVPGIRLVRLLWRMLGPVAIAANLVLWCRILGASDDLCRQAWVAALYVLGFSLLSSLIMELLSPRNKDLRLLRMRTHRAERLAAIARGLLVVLLGTQLAIYLVRANGWSESVAALLELLRTVGLILFAWSALSRSGALKKITPEDTEGYGELVLWLLVRFVLPLTVLTVLFYTIASALGYEALSRWVLESAAWTAGVVIVAAVVYRLFRRRLRGMVSFMRDERSADEASPVPVWIGLERILAGALKLVVIAAVFLLVLSIWNLSLAEVGAQLRKPIFGGGSHTWGMFLGGLFKIALVLLAHAVVRNLLIFFVFPKTDVELGARYAILTVLQYGMIVMVVLFAFSAIGVDTSTLAVFAGGATVGLAFGMKDIFSNFFSGLIMLLERPVRVGDDIEAGETRGRIEAIRLRGTRIRTFDGQVVIVPNTEMIGSRITNFSQEFRTARMQVDVGVSYEENPEEVIEILYEVAKADARVLTDPAPAVRFNSFGNSSLDFSLRIWTREISERWAMVSDLRTKIFEAFRKSGIEIPFPQQDIHIRSDRRMPQAASVVGLPPAAEAPREGAPPTTAGDPAD
jgi:small-conductance mechanosensitive channel